jgi:hypothetical protein
MLQISEDIKKLPKKQLKKWVEAKEKQHKTQDWKDQLAKLKESYVSRTGTKSEDD